MNIKRVFLPFISGALIITMLCGFDIPQIPPAEQSLLNAISKQLDIDSATYDTTMSLNISTEGIEIGKEDKSIIDAINKSLIMLNSKVDMKHNRALTNATLKIDAEDYKADVYVDGNRILVKPDGESKYIDITGDKQLNSHKAQMLGALAASLNPNKTKELAIKFLKEYVANYGYSFKNITSSTIDGLTVVTITIDSAELKDILKYTAQYVLKDESFRTYFKALIESEYQYSKEEQKKLEDDIDSSFEEARKGADEFINTIMDNIKVGPNGIVVTYGIDNKDNIVRETTNIDLVITNPDDASQSIGIKLDYDTTISNINKTVVEKISPKDIIPFRAYVKGNKILKNSSVGAFLGVQSKKASLRIGDKKANSNGNDVALDAEPYIDEASGRTMVPVRFAQEALGGTIEWDATSGTVTCKDDEDNQAVIRVGSRQAYVNGALVQLDVAPVIKNGRTMGPLRAISEVLNANINWDETTRTVTIDKD